MTARAADGGRPVVVLCGFMGTGKTAVGRELARLLGVEFIDTDAVIEAREGMTIAAIFDKRGESHFRALERDVCHALAPEGGAVIATGGGMPMDRANLVHLQTLGTTVLLEASIDAIVERTGGGGDRPLLYVDPDASPQALRHRAASLLEAREPVYGQCRLRLDTTVRTPAESAFDVMEMLAALDSNEGRAARELIPLRVDTRPLPGRGPHPGNTRLCRVVVGRGACADLGAWLERLEMTTRVFFLAPAHIAAHVLPRVTPALDAGSVPWHSIGVDDGDAAKTMAQVERLVGELADAGATRDSVAVAVGGGVTGDVAGFAASVYMRGLPFVQMPTSLLAMVDASIGGKVGVNDARAKNLVGAVYHPHLVLVDPDLLDTLPARERANGMAEVIKTAIIGDAGLFERLLQKTPPAIEDVVAACARVKARVVERDPFERDLRRVLNLGHTAGHALEAALGYRGLAHGEAVGLGLLAAWRVAVARGVAEERWLDDTRRLVELAGLPTRVPDVDPDALRAALRLDKKRREGALTFVLPVRPGRVEIVDDVGEDELLAALGD